MSISRKYRWLNYVVGRLCAVCFGVPFKAFRYVHLQHHKYTNHPLKDPDYWAGRGSFFLFFFLFSLFYLFYLFVFVSVYVRFVLFFILFLFLFIYLFSLLSALPKEIFLLIFCHMPIVLL